MPLAASLPLTVPPQKSLSQFRLAGLIVLLKVSSAFDTIPFIKDYLQEEIKRRLFQEELLVALYQLSLLLLNLQYAASLSLDAHDPDPASPM
ncbi:hypothetical protein HOY80DRAFT_1058945 [Tuber brumale]|nr:hypothetical protein HOY80DRAFT_1058945 [Tuber brumale]